MVMLKKFRKAVSKRTGMSGFLSMEVVVVLERSGSKENLETLVTDNKVKALPEDITTFANTWFYGPNSSNVTPTPPLEMKPGDVLPNPNSTQSVHLTIQEGRKSEHEGCKGDESIESEPQEFESRHHDEEFFYEKCNDALPKDPEQLKPNFLGYSEPEVISTVNSGICEQISPENQPSDSMWVETHDNVELEDPEKVEQLQDDLRARLQAIEIERQSSEDIKRIMGYWSILTPLKAPRPLPDGCLLGSPRCGISSF